MGYCERRNKIWSKNQTMSFDYVWEKCTDLYDELSLQFHLQKINLPKCRFSTRKEEIFYYIYIDLPRKRKIRMTQMWYPDVGLCTAIHLH